MAAVTTPVAAGARLASQRQAAVVAAHTEAVAAEEAVTAEAGAVIPAAVTTDITNLLGFFPWGLRTFDGLRARFFWKMWRSDPSRMSLHNIHYRNQPPCRSFELHRPDDVLE